MDSLFEQFKKLPAEQQLSQARRLREQVITLLKQRIAEVQREREEMNAQYDEDVGEMEAELFSLGVGQRSQPNDVGVKAYNYLLEHRGQKIQAGALMRAIRCEGAVAAVVLAPFIEDGRIKHQGERRGRAYWIDNPDGPAVDAE